MGATNQEDFSNPSAGSGQAADECPVGATNQEDFSPLTATPKAFPTVSMKPTSLAAEGLATLPKSPIYRALLCSTGIYARVGWLNEWLQLRLKPAGLWSQLKPTHPTINRRAT